MFSTMRRLDKVLGRARRRQQRLGESRRLRVEPLEDRRLLTIDLISGVADSSLLGDAANGPCTLERSATTADGRYVVFSSSATNLVSGDANGVADVFVRDMQTGVVALGSTNSAGQQANAACDQPSLSDDGKYLVFRSTATNLVSDDTLDYSDIFLKNLATGTTTRVSTTGTGTEAYNDSHSPAISGDGRYVVFCSAASNLVASDDSVGAAVFKKDLQTGAITRVSNSQAGDGANLPCANPAISGDGRYVAFETEASNLVSDDTNSHCDVFVKDTQSGSIGRASTATGSTEADSDSECASISRDGRYVVFCSHATDLVASDTNGLVDAFIKDRTDGVTRMVSVDSTGKVQGNADAYNAAISANGQCVTFCTAADNLVDDDNNQVDVLMKHLQTGEVTLVSVAGETQTNQHSYCSFPSGDGRYVVFCSSADNLVADDTNGADDIFRVDLQSGAVSLVSTSNVTVPGPFTAGGASDSALAISGDGRYVAFRSAAANLVEGDTNGVSDVFVRDLQTGAIRLVSTGLADARANAESDSPSISREGRYVAFRSAASNLVEKDTNGLADIFVKDMDDSTVRRVNTSNLSNQQTTSTAGYHPGDSDGPSISADGRFVAFRSYATNLVTNDTNGFADVFVKDTMSNLTVRVSTQTGGAEFNNASSDPAISSNGRYVAFESIAAVPVPAADVEVYVHDTWSGVTTLVSTSQAGATANGDSDSPSISDSGQVAFRSDASNLVDGDNNGRSDVFLKDLTSGAVTLVSVHDASMVAGDTAAAPEISDSGRYVVFVACAAGQGVTDGLYKVLVHDLQTGEIEILSTGGEGADQANGECYGPTISRYGTFVAFSSLAANLVAGDGNATYDVFRVTNPVGNTAPTAITLDSSAIDENAAVGSLVGTLATTDADAGDLFTYTLLDNADGRFKLSGSQLLVADDSMLDYETDTSHLVRIRSTDQVQNSFERQFTISLVNLHDTDAAALFDPSECTFYLHKDNTTGVADYTFSYGDPTGGWELLSGDWDGDGCSGVGLYDANNSMFYLTDSYSTGYAEYSFVFGETDFSVTFTGTHGGQHILDTAITVNTSGLFRDGVPVSASVVVAVEGLPKNEKQKIVFSTLPDSGTFTLTFDPDGAGPVVARTTATLSFNATAAEIQSALEQLISIGPGNVVVSGSFGELTPLVGDWNGNGADGVGVYDPQSGTFRLTDTLGAVPETYTFTVTMAEADWIPVVGDWNGDGVSGVGLYDPEASHFYLINSLDQGFIQYHFGYGEPGAGWEPLVGDWDRDRADGVGLYNEHSSTFYLRNDLSMGFADHTIGYGVPDAGWEPLVGDWDGDNQMGIGLYDPSSSTFYLSNRLSSGYAETTLGFGQPKANWQPLVGCWVTASRQVEATPAGVVSAADAQAAPAAAAVDQIELAGLAAYELERLRTSSLDDSTDLFAAGDDTTTALDEALAEL